MELPFRFTNEKTVGRDEKHQVMPLPGQLPTHVGGEPAAITPVGQMAFVQSATLEELA
jgi:hypothetical protein